MRTWTLLALLVVMAVALVAAPAMAQDEHGAPAEEPAATVHADASADGGMWIIPSGDAGRVIGVSIAIGLIVMGAAKGIARIGSSAVESIARQPEAGDRIFTSMIIAAALIEGFTFFALLIQFTVK